MSQETLLKHQFTIQNFNFPMRKSEPTSTLFHKRQKPSLHSNYQSERRIICAHPNHQPMRDRWDDQVEDMDANPQRFASLPEIKGKSKGNDGIALLGENRTQSFSSRKLNVNAYRKIGESINKKYCRKMESLASTDLQTQKVFSIKTLRGDLTTPKLPQRARQERVQKHAIDTHHIDRFKDHLDIPLELQTQRYREQEYDDRQQSLQLKNIIRFELYSNISLSKPKKQQQEQHIPIDGWGIETSTLRHAAQLYS